MLGVEPALLNERRGEQLQQAVAEIHPARPGHQRHVFAHDLVALALQARQHHLVQMQIGMDHVVLTGLLEHGRQAAVDNAHGLERTLLQQAKQNAKLLPRKTARDCQQDIACQLGGSCQILQV